jgi:hypothetical protein
MEGNKIPWLMGISLIAPVTGAVVSFYVVVQRGELVAGAAASPPESKRH